MRYLLTVQYLGTRYSGWQRQANGLAVQEVVENALAEMIGKPITVVGASRTDAGVHAAAQQAHADLPEIRPRGLILGLNNLLPPDVRISDARPVPDKFHAQWGARSKIYRYRIWNADVHDPFVAATHAHVAQTLDVERMKRAAAPLLGEHDFRAYTVANPEVQTTTRTVSAVDVWRHGNEVTIEIGANGFLRYMVRRIAGQLIEIGRGKIAQESAAQALEPHFAEARWTAPAEGLILWRVEYEPPAA